MKTDNAVAAHIDVRKVMEYLPHRYPFLMVDRVLEMDAEKVFIRCMKNVTINEPFFQGHFPGLPLMPGVMILEALAQSAGIFIMANYPECLTQVFVFSGIDKVRFRKPVVPGDQLILQCSDFRRKMSLFKTHCEALVDGKLAVEAELTGAMVNREEF